MKIGINGFGRIGRAIYRINKNQDFFFEVPIVNDTNPDPANIAYQLNYDTTYGNLADMYEAAGNKLSNGKAQFEVTSIPYIDEVDWNKYGVEIIVDASGIKENVLRAKKTIEKNASVQKVVITHCPKEVDYTMVIGVNDDKLTDEYDVISSSICDATAIAPVLKLMYENFSIQGAAVTTVHPMLSYQKVLDGSSVSWADPSQTYTHYALGRSVFDTIIPKPTTAVDETYKVLGIDNSNVAQFSYRTPTTIVGSADISLFLSERTSMEKVETVFSGYVAHQTHKIIKINRSPLVSLDFKGCDYSVIVDDRWTNVSDGKIIKLVLWYDNEWGYSSRVVDQLKLLKNIIESR